MTYLCRYTQLNAHIHAICLQNSSRNSNIDGTCSDVKVYSMLNTSKGNTELTLYINSILDTIYIDYIEINILK